MFEPTAVYTPDPNRYAKDMVYNHAGTSGLQLPGVSLGMWHNFGDNNTYEHMKQLVFTAFDNGITHFDLANNYGPEPGSAEKNCGRLLREYFSHHRDELLISTKAGYEMWLGPYGDLGSRKYLLSWITWTSSTTIIWMPKPRLRKPWVPLLRPYLPAKPCTLAFPTTMDRPWKRQPQYWMSCMCRSSSTRTATTSSTAPSSAMV